MKFKQYIALMLIVVGVIFGIIIYSVNRVNIHDCTVDSKPITLPYSEKSYQKKSFTYECSLDSYTEQNVKIGIAVDDSLDALFINNKAYSLEKIKEQYKQPTLKDWLRGYNLHVKVKSGKNSIKILGYDGGGKYGIKIAQSYSYLEYIVFFILSVLPFITGMYIFLFDWIFEASWQKIVYKLQWKNLVYVIFLFAIALRILFLVNVPNNMYQHDYKDHIDAIHYYAQYPLDVPQVDKSVQFPQQPLYYLSSAGIYSVSKSLGFSEHDRLYFLRVVSVAYSIIGLLLAFLLARLYLHTTFSINLFMAFIAFTPSFIFLSAVINNDTLNALFGIWALYEIGVYAIRKHTKHFYLAFLAIILAVLTKISSLLFAIYFVIVLLYMYYQNIEMKEKIKKQILLFGLVIVFIFLGVLIKSHIPANNEFRFVNSALYADQIIKAFDVRYFFTFHWLDLINEAQSHVLGKDSIRYSLFTYFYGTMYLGEFKYLHLFKAGELFKLSTQMILFFGIVNVIGLFGYFSFYKKFTALQKMLLIPIAINFVLILKFLLDYWVVCNSDFRYFTPSIGAIGLVFALGLDALTQRFGKLKKPMVVMSVILVLSELYWISNLIEKT